MAFTNEDYLPSPKELEIDELPVTGVPLKAAAYQLGLFCDHECKVNLRSPSVFSQPATVFDLNSHTHFIKRVLCMILE